MNQAIKSMAPSLTPLFPSDVTHLVMKIHDDFDRNIEEIREVMMKMKDGRCPQKNISLVSHLFLSKSFVRWLVGRKSEQREFYSILNTKEDISSLIDIQGNFNNGAL
jgi:hypothetical protein